MTYSALRWSRRALLVALMPIVHAWGANAQQLAFAPDHATGIYAVGERVGWTVSVPAGTTAEVLETARYFDVVNFASLISARSLVAMGFIDDVSPPAGIWAAFNQIKGPKEAAPMFESPHNHLATPAQQLPYTQRSAEWLGILVRGGDPTVGRSK